MAKSISDVAVIASLLELLATDSKFALISDMNVILTGVVLS